MNGGAAKDEGPSSHVVGGFILTGVEKREANEPESSYDNLVIGHEK